MDDHEITARLRAARASDPMPPTVADRLDAVLAELVAERAAGESDAAAASDTAGSIDADAGARVVTMTGRRRRATTWLLAAAAVAALGFGVPAVLGDGADDTDRQSATSDRTSQPAEEPFSELNDEEDAGSSLDSASESLSGDADQRRRLKSSFGLPGNPVRLSDLRPAERRAIRGAVAASESDELTAREYSLSEDGKTKGEVPTAALAVCVNPTAADAESEGLVLMERGVAADADEASRVKAVRRVDVYRCGADGEFALLTSVTLPPRE